MKANVIKKSSEKKRKRDPWEEPSDAMFESFAKEIYLKDFQQKSSKQDFPKNIVRKKAYKQPTRKRRILFAANQKVEGDEVPDEIIMLIFSYLPLVNMIHSVGLVCSQWRKLLYDNMKYLLTDHKTLSIRINNDREELYFNYFSHLKEISVMKSKSQMLMLLQLIEKSPNLLSLNISDSLVDLELIAKALASCLSLRKLCVDGCVISREMELYAPNILQNLEVLHMNRTYNTLLGDTLDICRSLIDLQVSSAYFDDEDLDTVTQHCGQTLHTLNLSSCFLLTASGLSKLSLCTNLKRLDLSMPQQSRANSKWAIDSAISILPASLTYLSLYKNPCFRNAAALQDAFVHSSFIGTLEELDLRRTLPDEKKEVITKVAKKILTKCKSLKRLIIDTGVYDRIEERQQDSMMLKRPVTWANIENAEDKFIVYI
jgi:hypothetical protein